MISPGLIPSAEHEVAPETRKERYAHFGVELLDPSGVWWLEPECVFLCQNLGQARYLKNHELHKESI